MEHLVCDLLKVVHRVAQVVPLRVVEIDYVLALIRLNRQRFRRRAVIVVAADINLFACRRDLSSERLILHGLCLVEHIGRALLKVVHRVAQIGLLRVVEIDYVLALIRLNRQRFRRRAVIVVAADINLFACRRDLSSERLILHGLCLVEHIGRALLKVVHRVAQIGLLRVVEIDYVLALIRLNRQRFRRRAVIVVAADINLFACRRDLSSERLILHGLCLVEHIGRALLKVVHRVAQVGLLRKLRRERRILIQRIGSCVCRFLIQLAVDVIQVIICLTIISFPTGKLISIGRRRNRDG